MSKPLLVISTSSSCGHCAQFKLTEREDLLKSIKGMVDVIELDETTFSQHREVLKYIRWYPHFMLFSRKHKKQDPLIMGGLVVRKDGKIKIETNKNEAFSYKQENVRRWIENKLKIIDKMKPEEKEKDTKRKIKTGSSRVVGKYIVIDPQARFKPSPSDSRKKIF